jgi:hypothetical protein
MRPDRQLGFDELMIVNPSSSRPHVMFLGEDGTLYQLQGLDGETMLQGLGQCFLGKDGALYQVQGFDEGVSTECGEYFLGSDGRLYEVVR